jgi:DNA-directed RNA polymerase specialized sigma subunit
LEKRTQTEKLHEFEQQILELYYLLGLNATEIHNDLKVSFSRILLKLGILGMRALVSMMLTHWKMSIFVLDIF